MIKMYDPRKDETREATQEDFDEQHLIALMRCLQLRRLKQMLVDRGIPLPDGYRLTSGEPIDTHGNPVPDPGDWRKQNDALYEKTKARFLEIGGAL